MTQAEMVDTMYKHFDGNISKTVIEKAFQKVFIDIKHCPQFRTH